jgi:predicted MFS family arabinose efflux permease
MTSARLFLLLAPYALAYGASYFFRNTNAVAGPVLAVEFSLNAQSLGLLTSAYFLTFALAQVPLGMALDRFGPARVNTLMLLSSALGAAVFALAQDATTLAIGRALIGLGAGCGLMAVMSATHMWAPKARVATIIGFIMSVGGIGALTASSPLQWAISAVGWRAVFWGLCAYCTVTAVAVFATRGAVKPAAASASFAELTAGVKTVFAAGRFWRYALPVMFVLGTMLAFQTLWAATWLRDVTGMRDKVAISHVLFALNLGMTFAFLLNGLIADKLYARGVARETTLKGYFIITLLAQVWIMAAPTTLPHLAWALYVYGANSSVLAYSILVAQFPAPLTSRVNTAINLMAFATAFVLQWVIGAVLNSYPVNVAGYAVLGYYQAWMMLFGIQLLVVGQLWITRSQPPSHALQ